jgi:hypothetical protein
MNHLCGWMLGMLIVGAVAGTARAGAARPDWAKADLKAGMIGTDTSHCMAFANLFHAHPEWGVRIVAAFKNGSRDNPESWNRVEGYAKELKDKHGIEICDTVDALLAKVDVVLIECVDGRPHLEYARPVLAAKKRLFIDKPFTAGLADAREILRLSKESGTPFFSCSCVRFQPGIVPFRSVPLPREEGKGEGSFTVAGVGKLVKAQGSSPLHIEPHHPDLFWYGVHGVEALYTVLGRGCVSVQRKAEGDYDITTGQWADGRVGIFRGATGKAPYLPLVKVWGTEGEHESQGGYDYAGLVETMAKFFQTGVAPIDPQETLEIVEFMIAAQLSKERGGAEVKLEELRK